jgi:hypothetical protein
MDIASPFLSIVDISIIDNKRESVKSRSALRGGVRALLSDARRRLRPPEPAYRRLETALRA